MTIYISQGRYTPAAIKGMSAKPEDRSEAVAELFAAAGGRLISWYLYVSDVTARADDVSSLGESRHCGCEYLRSDFDPRVRPLQPWGGGWSNLWSLSAQDRWSSSYAKSWN